VPGASASRAKRSASTSTPASLAGFQAQAADPYERIAPGRRFDGAENAARQTHFMHE
jgi:hypothetical protein